MSSQIYLIPGLSTKDARSAEFSKCGKYRYRLEIIWQKGAELCQFIGLNPSTATEFTDDPTIRRCKAFAKSWGYGGMIMTNIFALRETDPDKMIAHVQPIGERRGDCETNDTWIFCTAARCKITIACWGLDGAHMNRGNAVSSYLIRKRIPLHCIRKTKEGFPEHPLYLPKTLIPIRYV
jgi:hypothetical protein